MVKMSCKPPMSVSEYKEFSIKLLQFTSNLATDLNLPVSNKKHLLLGPNELQTLMEHNVETGSPFAVEDNLLYLILIHTMARPGSLVTTQAYPDAFFKWGEVKFTRRFADNVVVGVDVELVLKRLKGKRTCLQQPDAEIFSRLTWVWLHRISAYYCAGNLVQPADVK
jgi:hypothetical protein